MVEIKYDKGINQVYIDIDMGMKNIQIDRTEIATVEKIFDAMDIPYTEKLGEQKAWDYINADNKQYINKDGKTVEIAVVYEKPMPVLHRKETNPSKKVGYTDCFQGKYALLSNETEMYDFFILKYSHDTPDEWIIQDADGNIRVWNPDCRDCCGEEFFGRDDNYICERTADNTYIEVAI